MSKYKGLFTYDIGNHKYIPVEQTDGLVSDMNYRPEPKEYWFINGIGNVEKAPSDWLCDERASRESIGNHFSSEEEAEKAVEKLKAWKRLKDKGFRFDGYDVAHKSNGNLAGQIFYDADNYSIEDVEKEMDLLFRGEE